MEKGTLWVDKFSPSKIDDIVGNRAAVKKLYD